MGTFRNIAIVAVAHMAFLVAAYGTSFFGLHLPRRVTIVLWLGASSLLALAAYVRVLVKSSWLETEPSRTVKLGICAVTFTLVSLIFGIFIAYDTFGS